MTEPSAPSGGRVRQRIPPAARGHSLAAAILLAPALLGFLVFWIYPAIRGFGYSVTDYNLLNQGKFVGGENFINAINDGQVWQSLRITVVFAVGSVVISLTLAMLLAALMQRLRTKTWVRAGLLLPWLVPNVAVALIWAWLLDANVGYLKGLLDRVGETLHLNFLTNFTFYNSEAALNIVILIGVWAGVGYTALLLFAGMMQVPTEYYEAGAIDGASETTMFFRITLPLIRPVIALVVVVSLIGSFQVFDLVQVGYGNNPIPEVRVIYFYIYQQAFNFLKMGYASAIALLLAIILAVLTLVQLRLLRANRSDLA
ncbi:carbohydrate ABC transporter permease [Tessaracoccus sp. OH4464_COT-324]|uniref:carbohydrate ABC transporter permease n=1 Tax=Tessaracoccus sp. OH4464_COT-324 TaxID=2491059 RepID=UPI000F62E368|nr:sugar ABC transporter permease [Tessaracoccus sp. OH4464_COT-324]RRD46294.1 sugar ABC transporter permease [Tessaracoccus sp. OH4464_COT-324]